MNKLDAEINGWFDWIEVFGWIVCGNMLIAFLFN
jgi:hypothetical protein